MDWVNVQSNWDHYRSRVKARWARLSDAHLDAIAGERGQLAGVVREVYGVSSDEVEKQIKNFEMRNRDYRPQSSSCSKWRSVEVSAADRK